MKPYQLDMCPLLIQLLHLNRDFVSLHKLHNGVVAFAPEGGLDEIYRKSTSYIIALIRSSQKINCKHYAVMCEFAYKKSHLLSRAICTAQTVNRYKQNTPVTCDNSLIKRFMRFQ